MRQSHIADIRRTALQSLCDSMFGGVAAKLARTIERDPNQVRQWLAGTRNITEGSARWIEEKVNVTSGTLDRSPHSREVILQPDEAALLQKYRASSPSGRVAIQNFAGLSNGQRDQITDAMLQTIFGPAVPDARLSEDWRNPETRTPLGAGTDERFPRKKTGKGTGDKGAA